MTRLSPDHISLAPSPGKFNEWLKKTLGTDLLGLAARAWDLDPKSVAENLSGKKLAAISISSGEGTIEGFAETSADTGSILGFDAKVMEKTDDAGFGEAEKWGADVTIHSDDDDFLAIDIQKGITIHNNPATSRIFVAALEFLNGAPLKDRRVFVIGLGPVGVGAAIRLSELKARPFLYDRDKIHANLIASKIPGSELIPDEKTLAAMLKEKDPLIFEAVPKAKLFKRVLPNTLFKNLHPKIAAPGVPLSWPLSWLEPGQKGRLFHEPLAAGTAAMLAGLSLPNYDPEYGRAFPGIFPERVKPIKKEPIS
jgi:hypothetical protein